MTQFKEQNKPSGLSDDVKTINSHPIKIQIIIDQLLIMIL